MGHLPVCPPPPRVRHHDTPPTPEQLDDITLLKALTPAERARLADTALLLPCARGRDILVEGEAANGIHVLLEGLVKVYHNSLDGRELVLHVVRPQSPIGLVPLFKDVADPARSVWPASAAALQPSTTLFIPTAAVFSLLRGNPEWALQLLSALAQRLYMFSRKAYARGERVTLQRLAAYLLHRSRLEGNAETLSLNTGRETLSSMLSMARETLSRTLGKLDRSGAVSIGGKLVRVCDRALLQALAGGGAALES